MRLACINRPVWGIGERKLTNCGASTLTLFRHIGGVNALRMHLGGHVKVAAHRFTAAPLADVIRVDRYIEGDEVIKLNGSPELTLRAMHTPGHARGHLCFYEERTGTLISGDNIVG